MSDLESQFEKAFTEIPYDQSGRHLLDAEAVTECVVRGSEVTVTLDLPSDEASRRKISGMVEERIQAIPGIDTVRIRMKGEAPAGQTAPAGPQAPGPQPGPGGPHPPPQGSQPRSPQRPTRHVYLENYDGVIAVASGKGGVGKSTVAVNLAITLAQMGNKVSLFDADIYGPSLPIMMGLRTARPAIEDNRIQPIHKHGVDVISIGNLIEEAAATIWRGPMVHQVLEQLLRDTEWPGGDFMVVDLPPGTGDAQLTLSQLCEVAGAVIVTTPQDVALLDAVKGIAMFQKVDIPVIGLVENMSAFVCPHCGHETAIFDTGNAQKAAGQHGVPFLGGIPLDLAIREGSDSGVPVATVEASPAAAAFREVAEGIVRQLERMG